MNRSHSPLVWLGLASTAAVALVAGVHCNNPACGPGTKQVQAANGELNCVPAEATPAQYMCDRDAGAKIVAGACVSAISCGPNTKLDPGTGLCVGTGSGGGGLEACPTPAAGTICVNGQIRHLVDNSPLATGEKVRVALYDPLSFLQDPGSKPLVETETDGFFIFKDVPTPGAMLIALAVTDPTGAASPTLFLTGSGAQVLSGQSYQIDGFATPKSVVDGWKSQGGPDCAATGCYLPRFYLDSAPPPTQFTSTATMPASGVKPVIGASTTPPNGTKYFGTSLTMIDTSLMATSAIGAAILPDPGGIKTFTGTGGMKGGMPVTWQTNPGGTTVGVLFVASFYPKM